MKNVKKGDFKEESTRCGWNNNVVYDISTQDDKKNKTLFGRWC